MTQVPTGSYSHPRCYAAELGGCSNTISGEHAVSQALLKVFAVDEIVEITGLRWMDGDEHRHLPTSVVKANILCTAHNAALSGLDTLAGEFAGRLNEAKHEMETLRKRRVLPARLFDGHSLERWCIKVVCGLAASGMADMHPAIDSKTWRPPIEWLRFLFHADPLPPEWGLYFIGQPGDPEASENFSFGLISDDTIGPHGLSLILVGKRFVMALARAKNPGESLITDAAFRPAAITVRNGINETAILFGWDMSSTGTTIVIVHPNPRHGPSTLV